MKSDKHNKVKIKLNHADFDIFQLFFVVVLLQKQNNNNNKNCSKSIPKKIN